MTIFLMRNFSNMLLVKWFDFCHLETIFYGIEVQKNLIV